MDIDEDKLEPPGTGSLTPKVDQPASSPGSIKLSSKGVENAKKRLRAFSIQKKTPITPIAVPKPSGSGHTTVVIGKLSSVKTTPKPDVEPDVKKPPKPPKPGTIRKALQESYSDQQKKTLSEIEDMKRKMELVDLGIPLGLICPTATSEQAMPTKAMPPIKSFLNKRFHGRRHFKRSRRRKYSSRPEQLDEIIREAKRARNEGRQFKFDYQKLLPDYDNPFQKRKDDFYEKDRYERRKSDYSKDDRRSDKYDYKKHSDYRKDDSHKSKYKDKDRGKSEKKSGENQLTEKETDVNLNDFLVCDSWSLDNDDKIPLPSPKVDDKHIVLTKQLEPSEILKTSLVKTSEALKHCIKDSPRKVEKLQPVIDSFKFELDPIDPNEDEEVLDIFSEKLELKTFAQRKLPKTREETPKKKTEMETELYDKDMTDINEDTFLEAVINEIKQEKMSDDDCEKGLVEYDISPSKDSPEKKRSGTPDIDELGSTSQRSDYSGYASTDSYRTTGTNESGYKSVESSSFRISPVKELNASEDRMSRPTVDSLETWSFVLKICQPLLFRHDKNKCYKETLTTPKVWYTENPKRCMCVKDRAVVYEELEMCKMGLVDRVYGCDQIADSPTPVCRSWYPRAALAPSESALPMTNEWEADDSQHARPETPQRGDEILLDREYQRFMEAVESKVESSRSTTPVRQEKKKRKEVPKEVEEKKIKKISEDWSQESDIDMEVEKTKKLKEKEKSRLRKRKHSSSTQSSVSESDDSKRKKKSIKKKALKKVNSKSAKKRRIGRKILKKLKEKDKKKRKYKESDDEEDKKKDKKSKKKKLLKAKKKISKKKKKIKIKSSSSSSSSSSDSDSDSESESDKKKKAKKKNVSSKKKKSKKRKQSTSESAHSEELFDVNILNNIKTERLTDDDFSPRRQKPREIINVKELQNDFVGNNIEVKKEIIEQVTPEEPIKAIDVDETSVAETIDSGSKDGERERSVERIQSEIELNSIPVPEDVEPVKVSPVHLPESSPVDVKDTKPEVKTEVRAPIEVRAERMVLEDTNMSQSSSQESVCSVKEPAYEKDDSYLRPSSQNSNYSFHDVMAAGYKHDEYEPAGYEVYEQLAMAYQSDVASQRLSPCGGERRIETVVHPRCGEIKCDWRPGDLAPVKSPRPSRWGLKPSEVNIVLTGGSEADDSPPRVFPIPSLANRDHASGYDEAYLDMYGAADRLQYGDCFSEGEAPRASLDDRISQALRTTVLGEVAKDCQADTDNAISAHELVSEAGRGVKRVSFADGYKPGQDSDVEEPPVKKRKRSRRAGCAWPCPASHPDHVPLWDALPPPPPPPGSPPRPHAHALVHARPHVLPRMLPAGHMMNLPHAIHAQFDPNASLTGFLPPEPPPGLIALR